MCEMSGSKDILVFKRNTFLIMYSKLYSHQQYMKLPSSPHTYQNRLLTIFLKFPPSADQCRHVMTLFYNSVVAGEGGRLFLFPVHTSLLFGVAHVCLFPSFQLSCMSFSDSNDNESKLFLQIGILNICKSYVLHSYVVSYSIVLYFYSVQNAFFAMQKFVISSNQIYQSVFKNSNEMKFSRDRCKFFIPHQTQN